MRWVKGQDTGDNGEALFRCKDCGHKEYRGGPGGEMAMENWEEG
jgi:hypothetical protein